MPDADAMPRFPVPPRACDCHFHVFGPPDRHPWPPGLAVAFPDATLAGHLAMQARTGLARMVLVQPSHYGTDNRCLLDALAAAGDRARGVVTVAPGVADAELDAMHALGVRGMRVNAGTGEAAGLPAVLATVEALAPRFAARGWHLQFILHGPLRDALLPRLADLPVPVVIDHMGLFRADRADGHPGFAALLRLLESGRCWVKVSGADRITRGGAVEAALPVMRTLIAARPDRMVWGSDWPHTDARVPADTGERPVVLPFLDVDENRLLAVLADACPDEATFRRILADNPARLYDFDRTRTRVPTFEGAAMKVLVVGSGGREHALCWAIAASPLCDTLWCAPGNAGIAAEAECVPIAADDVDALVAFARERAADLVVVGPEAPLVAGLVDRLTEAGIMAFGPTAAAAALEGSKGFTKDLCARHGIPTAAYGRFTDPDAARAYVRAQGAPIVVKADGLAAGKGVTVAATVEEALAAVDDALLGGRFGAAGAEVVIEEFLDGEEASFFALVDGETALPLAGAQDHKRVGDGDTGPNTGGMGAYSPAPVLTPAMAARVMDEIVRPTVRGMAGEGRPFRGVLYAGLMIGPAGPKLIEYNVRFGDPECQVLMARLASDLLPALVATCEGGLAAFDLRWRPETALCVVMAAKGYPGDHAKGTPIRNLEAAGAVDGVTLFHAGTAARDGGIVATGGRVLGVTALGADADEARARAYRAVDLIDWPDGFCRRDIGWRAAGRR